MNDKTALIFGSLLAAGQLHAACTGTQLDSSGILSAFGNGKIVCATKTGGAPLNTWSERHIGTTTSGGQLDEFAKGAGDPVDPYRVNIGSWDTTTSTGKITYAYTGDGTYTYDVWDHSGSYSFCIGSSEEATATVVTQPSNSPPNPCNW